MIGKAFLPACLLAAAVACAPAQDAPEPEPATDSAPEVAAQPVPAPAPNPAPTPAPSPTPAPAPAAGGGSCAGTLVSRGGQRLLQLADGTVVARARMTVNVDGSGRAYHRDGASGGAIIHLCNAGEVNLPSGERYHGSESNAVCTGRFMDDVARIGAAGWDDPGVGAVRWYGILGEGEATVAGRRVKRVQPVEVDDGSGFYISPTFLEDQRFPPDDQRRYVDALSVPHAVIRGNSGVKDGSFGVAWRVRGCPSGRSCEPTPFLVADRGPRVGEGSVWLTRAVNGLDPDVPITQGNRFAGNVGGSDVLWVFFNGDEAVPPYDAARVKAAAAAAFSAWGGPDRLETCRAAGVPDANG